MAESLHDIVAFGSSADVLVGIDPYRAGDSPEGVVINSAKVRRSASGEELGMASVEGAGAESADGPGGHKQLLRAQTTYVESTESLLIRRMRAAEKVVYFVSSVFFFPNLDVFFCESGCIANPGCIVSVLHLC